MLRWYSCRVSRLIDALFEHPQVARSALLRELAVVLALPTGQTSAGFPYLQPTAWRRLRDWVPHLFGRGRAVLNALEALQPLIDDVGLSDEERAHAAAARKVVEQVVYTAAITAPSDLWLVRYVVTALQGAGLAYALLSAEGLEPASSGLLADELLIDLRLLLSRGYLVRAGATGFRIAPHALSTALLQSDPLPAGRPTDLSRCWAAAATGDAVDHRDVLLAVAAQTVPDGERPAGLWMATPAEVQLGYALVPLAVGFKSVGHTDALVGKATIAAADLCPADEELGAAAHRILSAAGVLEDGVLGSYGRRVLERGPGPMGIIEAYHPYMAKLVDILGKGRGEVWVERSANVAASQVANAKSFERAQQALDRFARDTGYAYGVFIEHAMGKGEAIRQRWLADGDAHRYVGADLEDAAIDAAEAERKKGNLPSDCLLIRNADIANPATLLEPLRAAGLTSEQAVMLVGNGFHEARVHDDDAMTAVFAGYAAAGLVLLFTEETGLAVDDLLDTAWNTYHAGFKYVHERSGQGLRPATPRPSSGLEPSLPASWAECAERGGYVRLEAYCVRSRTVYPYPTPTGHNPAISVTHFLVPRMLADELGIG